MNMPPLRTVRPPSEPAVTPAPGMVRIFDPMLLSPRLPYAAKELLQELLDVKLIDASGVRDFLARTADRLPGLTSRDRTAIAVSHAGLLTPYQRDRVVAGSTYGLVLGAYRVLERLNGGSVGVVFRGEHAMLHCKVAIKVLPVDENARQDIVDRFHYEMAMLASLQHPHIVSAYDAGILSAPGRPTLHYLVLELITGGDLEQFVYENGAQPVARACEWARQIASGLVAAHDRNLIHRDLKPSNILLTENQQAKIIDFGLARRPTSTMTVHRALLGSVEFMAPEQSLDPTGVGAAADVYGLGVTLFWVLTGELPLERARTVLEAVKMLQSGTPRHIRELRPDVPEDLDALLARMLSRDPASRPNAQDVMNALIPFTGAGSDHAQPEKGSKSEVVVLRETVGQLEGSLRARDIAVRRMQDAVLFSLAKMAETQSGETVGHLRRMQEYVRVLADHLSSDPEWTVLQDSGFVAELIRCVPLHDIGKIRLPHAVLGKPDRLTPEEREVIETHTLIGCNIIESLGREYGESLTFLGVARAVIRSHHERWDGAGYPDRLEGDAIPPAARLVAVADVYDALRQNRPHRPGLDHAAAVEKMLLDTGHFDPKVREAFKACEKLFEEIELTIAN